MSHWHTLRRRVGARSCSCSIAASRGYSIAPALHCCRIEHCGIALGQCCSVILAQHHVSAQRCCGTALRHCFGRSVVWAQHTSSVGASLQHRAMQRRIGAAWQYCTDAALHSWHRVGASHWVIFMLAQCFSITLTQRRIGVALQQHHISTVSLHWVRHC